MEQSPHLTGAGISVDSSVNTATFNCSQLPYRCPSMVWPCVHEGIPSIVDEDLYRGTAKSIEGYLAGVLFKRHTMKVAQLRSIGSIKIPCQRNHFVLF